VRVTGALNVPHSPAEAPTGKVKKQNIKFNARGAITQVVAVPQKQAVYLGQPLPTRVLRAPPKMIPVTDHQFVAQTLIFVPKSADGHMSMVMPVKFDQPQLNINMGANLPKSPMGDDVSLSQDTRRDTKFGVL
jgi:hypothetical protein